MYKPDITVVKPIELHIIKVFFKLNETKYCLLMIYLEILIT